MTGEEQEFIAAENERLTFALEAAGVGTWDYDLQTGQAQWSSLCKQFFGLPPDAQVTATDLLARVHSDDRAWVDQANRQALSPDGTGQHRITYRTMNPDGTLRWVEAKGKTVRNAQGKAIRFSGIVQDVTQTVTANQKIEQVQWQVLASFEQAPVAMALFSGPQFVITMANDRVLEYWGRVREQVLNKPLFDALPEIRQQGYEELLTGVYTTGKRFVAKELSVILERKGKLERTYIDFVYEPFYGVDSAITGVSVVCIEITDQVLARQKMDDEQNRLTTILNEMPVGVLIARPVGELIFINQQVERIFRQPIPKSRHIEAYEQWPLFNPLTGEPFTVAELPMTRTLRSREVVTGVEMKLRRGDGSWGYVSVNSVPVLDNDGQLLYGVLAFVDITERKQAEAAVIEADRRKGEFLATLAHELRNPLAPIRNTLQILRLTDQTKQLVSAAVELMSRQVDQLVRMVDDLLDVSRIGQRKLGLRLERVELNQVVRQAVDANSMLFEQSDRELTVSIPISPVYLQADATRLTQVISNLLNNAVKFTPQGGHIWLLVERLETEALLSVRDTGIGIAAEQLEAIFEMFVQADTSLERSQSGLGLGLTLVRQLVSLHGGRVEAHSNGPQQGSEFRVFLPLSVEPVPTRQSGSASLERPITGRRILVIDDNPDATTTLAMLLKVKGHQVTTRNDGREGIAAAECERPEVIVLDIGMPNLNGYEVCRLIRGQPWGQSMLIIALTGFGFDEDRRLSKEAGFDAHLVKPLDLAALTQLLSTLPDNQ
ncbi:PAS domain-containing hybrid sensor histidine kinase/response regulator [Fibrella forsythiae]|uniref:histidine kinase n=1 Tax=Fibrella forsythiae TaxID=2817061 RepID=A0ABS3JN33_9BACT|nr:ATP-binding protein [Fibrella forsythiae]MBO0951411.1 PAS domain S-box protein [Fibrella forsythiae]